MLTSDKRCGTVDGMAERKMSGVRLSDEQRAALAKIAERNGCDMSDLIRWAVDALIAHVERNGGRLLLPVDFSETFEVTSPPPKQKSAA